MITHSFCTMEMTTEVVRQWQPQLPRFPIAHSFQNTEGSNLFSFLTTMFAGKLSFRSTKNINKFRSRKWEEEESGFKKCQNTQMQHF